MRKSVKLVLLAVFTVSLILPLMEISAVPAASEATKVVFFTGVQTTDTLTNMIADYNANYSLSGVTVELQTSTWETDSQHDTYAAKFAAQDSSFDIISMDVIWPPEFTDAGWVEPLDDIINSTNKDEFLAAPVEAGTYEGKIYGLPWFHDSAMLFYRTDVIKYAYDNGIIPRNGPPETWTELHDWTEDMLANTTLMDYFKTNYQQELVGFVWQGNEYEGMICDFMEYIGGTGTYTFLNEYGNASKFDQTGIRDALTFMRSLLDDGVSPQAVLTYGEEESRAIWDAGNAIFHRNWPYAYRLSLNSAFLNGSESSYLGGITQAYNVTVMPHKAGVANYRTSCLGGWQLGVNKFSTHKAEAKHFMLWLTAEKQQVTYLNGNGNIPTLKAAYQSADIDESQLYVQLLLPVFEAALPRPVHPQYPQLSEAIQEPIHKFLSGTITLDKCIDDANKAIENVFNPKPTGINDLAFLAVLAMGTLVFVTRKRKK
ncbi:MAG: ABC transporter substrate-binding protein [Candidatus Odinarchaeota archaeon]